MDAMQEALVLQNLDLPRIIYWRSLRRRLPRAIDEDECVSLGNLAMVRAASKWHRQGEFRDYAARCIFNEVFLQLRLLHGQSQLSRLDRLRLHRSSRPTDLFGEPLDSFRFRYDDEEMVACILLQLDDKDEACLWDRHAEGLSFKEMGKLRGLAPSNAYLWHKAALTAARILAKRMTTTQEGNHE